MRVAVATRRSATWAARPVALDLGRPRAQRAGAGAPGLAYARQLATTLTSRTTTLLPGARNSAFLVKDALRSSAQPLDEATRAFMEPRLGHDFSKVRVHADARAAEAARSVSALAYTVGNEVAFGAGQFSPHTTTGRRLLAHELTHVAQQRGASRTGDIAIGGSDAASEGEARQAAQAIANGAAHDPVRSRAPLSVQRAPLRGDDDPIHKPIIEDFRKKHGLPLSGVDPFGNPVGPSAAEIKYGEPAEAAVLAQELQTLIDNATWKEIRKRVYPTESAAGITRAKERHAGTRTDLTGLGQLKTLDHFAKEVKTIQANWVSLSRPDDRVKEVGKALNAEMTAVDVPGFLIVDREPMQWKGFFDQRAWRFVVSQELVSGATLSDKDAGELTNASLHEGRHAEQEFLSARFSAGVNKKLSAAIVTEQGIPKVIADEAVAKKFDSTTDPAVVDLGKRMHKAGVTDRAANQAISADDGIADLAVKRSEAESALKNLNAVPVTKNINDANAKRDALKAQIAVVEHKYSLYRAIPFEADAHEVGDAAEEAFKGWPP